MQHFDIHKPIFIEMEFDILESGYKLLPFHCFINEEGACIFTIVDTDPNWQGRPRPSGKYISTVMIPGNLLSEGILFVESGLTTLEPRLWQFHERDVVSFQVIDSFDGNTARGDWGGTFKGAVRPLLKWTNEYTKN
jgi:lipopolysaccharide transport system ATP-binding protein